MFRKLRMHLVLINIAITSIVLIVAFTAIYTVAKESMNRRMIPRGEPEFSQPEFKIIENRMRDDRKASLDSLLTSLIVVGVVVEAAVIILSLYLADVAIRPVQESYDAQKKFIANASHEIKTPLAAITASLEAADIHDNVWVDNVEKEVKILSALNSNLLQLAKIDGQKAAQQKNEVKVQQMTDEILAQFKPEITARKIQVKCKVIPQDAKLTVPKIDLWQILTILIDNAIKYSDKKLEIRYEEKKFLVKNDGKTLTAEELKHVFERFYQADKTTNGSGLGLAIAQALAERNDWKLELLSEEKFTVAKLEVK